MTIVCWIVSGFCSVFLESCHRKLAFFSMVLPIGSHLHEENHLQQSPVLIQSLRVPLPMAKMALI